MHTYKIEGEYSRYDDDVHLWEISQDENEQQHTHDFIELVYVKTGSACHSVDGAEYVTSRGSMVLINREQTHSFEIIEKPYNYINFVFKPSFISRELADTDNLFGILELSMFSELNEIFEPTDAAADFSGSVMLEIEEDINIMLSEYDNRNPGYRTVIRSYAAILLTHLIRKIRKGNDMDVYSPKITSEIINFIDENYNHRLTLSELADKCFYQPSYFSKVFNECFGKSLTVYIQEKRMSKALGLMKTTDLSIEEICEQVGYQSYQLFSRIFKKYTGKSPSAMRKCLKNTK